MSGRVVYGVTAGVSADKLLRGQLNWLKEQGWDVHLAVDPDEHARTAALREGVSLEELPMSRDISILKDLVTLCRWFALLLRLRPDAVNVSTPKAGLLGGLAAAVLRVPRRLYVVRGLRLESASGVLGHILWAMERLSIAVATDVVVVSGSLAVEAHRRRLIPVGRALLVGAGSSNGVPAKAVADRVAAVDPLAMRVRLGLSPADFVVGYVGRITSDKGIDTLLSAVANLPNAARVRLLLVGSIDDSALVPEVAALGDRCVHVDWTDDAWSFYSVMDALSLPTRREGFPNVVLEAAAAGVPAVTTRATGAVDSVVDGVTGLLVDVDDADGLRAALLRLAGDPALRASLGEAARRRAFAEYQPEQIWRGIESIMRGTPADHVRRV